MKTYTEHAAELVHDIYLIIICILHSMLHVYIVYKRFQALLRYFRLQCCERPAAKHWQFIVNLLQSSLHKSLCYQVGLCLKHPTEGCWRIIAYQVMQIMNNEGRSFYTRIRMEGLSAGHLQVLGERRKHAG